MKRFTLTLALALTLAMPLFAERVTPETAKKTATTFLSNNGAKASQLTDLSKAAGFPNLYIFTAEQGFVVMSADDCVQPILGYSMTGTFFAEDMPDNVRGWLQGYNDEIQSAIENQMRATEKTTQLWKALAEGKGNVAKATVIVAPLIQTKWNQNKYYNRLCPAASGGPDGHAYVGCAATAMAQIMKYYNYPSKGIGSHSYTWNNQTLSADFGATTYDWENMEDAYEYYFDDNDVAHWISGAPTEQQILAVATLSYHCGVSLDMNYGGGGSSAITAYAADALKTYFNYSPETTFKQKVRTNLQTDETTVYYEDDVWIAMVKAELDARRPLEYAGHDPNSDAGHAFVCDGYNNDNYFHFNWGWAGHYNGYFSINNLNTGANNESGSGNGVYTRNQAAIFGIEPVHCAASDPTNLTYTLNGLQDLTLNWDVATGAESYNIYRNGNLVGNSATNSYSETAPFGTNVYYVRSVDANGMLSLSSNSVSFFVGYQTPIVDDLTGTLLGNSVSLSWTAPEWCYPEEPSAVLTYGNGSFNSRSSTAFWAHRYLANDIAQYLGKIVYKISLYAYEAGSYILYIYNGTTSTTYSGDQIFIPNTLMTEKVVEVTSTGKWIDIDLDDLVSIDNQNDLWIVLNYPNSGSGIYPATFCSYSSSDNHGDYWGKWNYNYGGGRRGFVQNGDRAYLIRTYLTDGTYTYNLYDGTSQLVSNINTTNYIVNNVANNAAHLYTLKTNYYGGETNASNMVGITLGAASLASLVMDSNDQMTVTENSKLTITGTLSDASATNLILEDGAQLINDSEGVKATVKKTIQPYTEDLENGWNLIASPIIECLDAEDDVDGLVSGAYDLYVFDQTSSDGNEWRNYEAQTFTTIDNKAGYLYSNSNETMISFAGTLAGTVTPTTITRNDNVEFEGFNLIGNPYPCEVYTNQPYYTLQYNEEDDKTCFVLGESGSSIPPCTAILVQAQTAEESVTFSKTPLAKQASIAMRLTKSNTRSTRHIDQARISFEEGCQLSKYTWDDASSTIYIPQNGQNYAVAYANGANEMPINFKAVQNGTYTLGFETNNLELDYLHLIDNMSGDEVDILATPHYTFEAKTTDYVSRFRLVFSNGENAVDDDETFAYVSNGEIVINQEGTLQIVDMTGHMVISRCGHMQCVPTTGMAQGVYVLRLINGDKVKTQKIVVQ